MDVALLTIGYDKYLMPAHKAQQVQRLMLQYAWTADGSYEPVPLPACSMFPQWNTMRYRYKGAPIAQPRVRCLLLEPGQLLAPLPQRAPIDPLGLLDA